MFRENAILSGSSPAFPAIEAYHSMACKQVQAKGAAPRGKARELHRITGSVDLGSDDHPQRLRWTRDRAKWRAKSIGADPRVPGVRGHMALALHLALAISRSEILHSCVHDRTFPAKAAQLRHQPPGSRGLPPIRNPAIHGFVS